MDLKTSLTSIGPAFRMKKKLLAKLNLETVEDLLLYIPFRYENNAIVSKIGILQHGESVTIQGKVTNATQIYTKRGLTMQKITIEDNTGKIDAVFFNQKFILNTIHKDDTVSIAGRVEKFGYKKSMSVRNYEVLNEGQAAIHTVGLVPIYSQTPGLSAKWFRNRILNLLNQVHIEEYLPTTVRLENNLIELSSAFHNIHFPRNFKDAEIATKRLSFDELLIKHAASMVRKKEWESKQKAIHFDIEKHQTAVRALIKSLPFELTNAQEKAVNDMFEDLQKETPMNRLLEGDVGSGKTVVAAIGAYVAYLNGFQTAFMAPTEILATQHFETLKSILQLVGIEVELFTGSNKNKETKFDIAVGTHALIHKRAEFKKLGLVIIDEQQRFGVEQRAILREKGINPHLLSMTATPIPRTIFLTIYADLALSILDELPKGRKKIKTWLVPEEKREGGYGWIAEKIKNEKSQVFIVCPFIEPSETLTTVKAAKDEFEKLKKVFANSKLGLLHGKMKAKEKDEVINKFRNRKIDMLVATPVIEVGIDIPTADIMVIEASERFGLAQLHQLRGRVGRGEKESFCLLFSGSNSEKTKERLSYLTHINNGPELAEIDLKLRGPGDMFGTKQHGLPDLHIASLSDLTTVEQAQKAAEKLFDKLESFPDLKQKVEEAETPKISKD